MVLSTWESLLKLSLDLGFQLCYLVLLLNHRDLGLRGECFSVMFLSAVYTVNLNENTDLIISRGRTVFS